jgi:GntR family transcriptional regulator
MHSKPVDARLFLSASDGTPMYQQVIDQITAKVTLGDWPPGTALPSIRELASASQVSVITVKRAYQELERSGVIVTQHGKGSFVAESQEAPRALLRAELRQHLDALLACADRLGLSRDEIKQLLDDEASPEPTPSPRGRTR